jgi:hypothetical protein
VLEGRLDKILGRYRTRRSPLAGVHIEGTNRLCADDFAEVRGLELAGVFRYQASIAGGPVLPVSRSAPSAICVELPALHDVAAPG